MVNIQNNSIEVLVQAWLDAEKQGERFPVPFDQAWAIAGYSRKDSAKRKLEAFFDKGLDFHISVERSPHEGSRSFSLREDIYLSCNTFKEFCMVSKTATGKATRRYFIECEEKWQMVRQHYPNIAEDIESKRLDKLIELEKLKLKNNELDHTMLTMHGKETVLALRGMADQIVETEKPTIEVIDNRHNVSFKGQTLTQIKEFVAKKYGVKFKSGAEIKRLLERKKAGDLIAQTPRSILSDYVPEENLTTVYKLLCGDSRQLLLGEST